MTNNTYESSAPPWAPTRLLRGATSRTLLPGSPGQKPLFPVCNILTGSRPEEQSDEGQKAKAERDLTPF